MPSEAPRKLCCCKPTSPRFCRDTRPDPHGDMLSHFDNRCHCARCRKSGELLRQPIPDVPPAAAEQLLDDLATFPFLLNATQGRGWCGGSTPQQKRQQDLTNAAARVP